MSNIGDYMLGPIMEKDGKILPFSRMDVLLSIVLTVALMIIVLMVGGMFTTHETIDRRGLELLVSSLVIAIAIVVWNGRRFYLLGSALAVICFRLVFGVVIMNGHRLALSVMLIACAVVTLFCFKIAESNRI